ncbi:MAG TPA: DUF3617 family protein [Smithellaceae bacterium]|nr:DUF3617 family protein [Smithellaceae bacterium]
MKKMLIIVVVLLSVLWAGGVWAQLKDGLWEMTTQVQMKGMSQKMPPATFRQCITKNDPVPKQQDKNYDCKTTSLKVSGNTVNYAAECKGPEGVMTVNGKSTYTGNAMEGSATTSFKMKGQPAMEMTSRMTGTYVGPCK